MKKFFPTLNKYKNYIFADNAGGSQIPEQVLNKVSNFLVSSYVQPGANNTLSKQITNDLKEIKNITNILLNNKTGNIVYGGSCTQIVANLANSMEDFLKTKKGNIILTDFNHEACISPFERIANKHDINIKYWSLSTSNNTYTIDYNKLLEKVDNNTSLIVLPHVSNILGNIIYIKYLVNEIKKINPQTKILVDGVAYFPHCSVDVNDYGVDFYVVSFYKFCGLRISALYIKDDEFNESINNINHYFFDNAINIGQKLQLGGINFECASSIFGLKYYLLDFARFFNYKDSKNNNKELIFDRQLVEFIYEKIHYYEKIFLNMFSKFIENNNNIEILQCNNSPKVPIYSILFKDYNVNNVNLILNEFGILCKTGTFYCDRLLDKLKINKENGVLRISLMHYNGFDECTKIIEYLKNFQKFKIDYQFSSDSKYKDYVNSKLKESFNNLTIDKHYENKRMRAYSLLDVQDINKIKIVGNIDFYQSDTYNSFNGNNIRSYPNIDPTILNNDCFKYYVKTFLKNINTELLGTKYNNIIKFIQIHQIRVYAENKTKNTNLVPEGIHRDGYNFIAMICITRKNIVGAINKIYSNDKNIVHSVQLQEGEMFILNDNKMFHDVTPINLYKENEEGYRDIFVLTTIS